jgi:hypothetical protein
MRVLVGRTPWSAADAPVGLAVFRIVISWRRRRDGSVPRGPGGPPYQMPREVGIAVAQQRRQYALDELLEQCDAEAWRSEEEREWLDSTPVGGELI